jgi:MFS family permease
MELIENAASKLFNIPRNKLNPTTTLDYTLSQAQKSEPLLKMVTSATSSSLADDSNSKHQMSPFLLISRSPGLSFVFLSSILHNAGLSVVVPSLALRLESMDASPRLLGFIAAAAPLVSVISPTLTGFLADRVPKKVTSVPYTWVYFISMVCFIGGNLLQTIARGPIILGVARAIIGISTGSSAIGISHVTRELRDPTERMAVVSVYSGVEMMGYILGTATGGLLSSVDTSFFGLFHVDGFTAPTLFPAIAGLILTIVGLPGFARSERSILKDRQKEKSEMKLLKKSKKKSSFRDPEMSSSRSSSSPPSPASSSSPGAVLIGSTGSGSMKEGEDMKNNLSPQARTCILGIIIMLYCIASASYNAFETTSTPITGLHFGWGVRENAFLWTISGFIGCVASVFIAHIPQTTVRPSDLLILALVFSIFGPLLMLLSFSHDSFNSKTGALKIKDIDSSISEMRLPLFWIGFLVFDIANVIFESVFTLLFSTIVDAVNMEAAAEAEELSNANSDKDGGDDDDSDDDNDDGENKNEAFLFGLFNSIGWFLGCALGAIIGNMLFLISTSTLLITCSFCAVFILMVMIAVRKSMFSEHETGILLRRINICLGDKSSTIKNVPIKSNVGRVSADSDDEWDGHGERTKASLNRRQSASMGAAL